MNETIIINCGTGQRPAEGWRRKWKRSEWGEEEEEGVEEGGKG